MTPDQAINALREALAPDACSDEYLVGAWAFIDGWMTGGGPRPAMWKEAPTDVSQVSG